MINQSLAFNQYTTATHFLEIYIPGYYDTDNNWVGDSWTPPVPFSCTPIPYGDRDSGTNGQQLKATEIGERQPAFMQVHSTIDMPMKSYLTIHNVRYKVTSVGDLTDAGFYRNIVSKELEK